uniref:Uncharacterized protein n=1 Tax=Sphingobacterium sp. (strain 21) TaxID=743722 RepID=F4C8H3_SPHS2
MVERILHYHSFTIRVGYEPGLIHITNNINLWRFLDSNVRERTEWLANAIQQDYESIYGSPLKIKRKSFLMEIWGHLYFEYYLLKLAHFFGINHQSKTLQHLLQRSASIDCGESAQDNNRFIWDFLALFFKLFTYFLPNSISSEGLKK